MYLLQSRVIRVGALGTFKFPRGWYVYVGSAMRGLSARLARHQRHDKKLFWHIDYFVRYARIINVETRVTRQRLECRIARKVLSQPGAQIITPRFGASDCNCPTHLTYFAQRPRIKPLMSPVYFLLAKS